MPSALEHAAVWPALALRRSSAAACLTATRRHRRRATPPVTAPVADIPDRLSTGLWISASAAVACDELNAAAAAVGAMTAVVATSGSEVVCACVTGTPPRAMTDAELNCGMPDNSASTSNASAPNCLTGCCFGGDAAPIAAGAAATVAAAAMVDAGQRVVLAAVIQISGRVK